MIALWMGWAALVAALAGSAAATGERALRLWNRPVRVVWLLALVASVLAPIGALIAASAADSRGDGVVVAGSVVAVGTVGASATLDDADVGRLAALRAGADRALRAAAGTLAPLDRPLAALWVVLSGAAATALLASTLRLRRRRRDWRPATVDGTPVLVAADVGPAVMGGGDRRIVLPRWALDLDAPLRALVLRHEAEHLRAGDPRLLLAGVVALVLMPWSPAIWWQVRRLRLAVELDCDRRVLRAGGDVERYGLLLLAVSQRGGGMLRLAMPALSEGATDLERRIAAMTAPPPRRPTPRAAALAAGAAVVIALACVVPSPNTVSGPAAPGSAEPAARVEPSPATLVGAGQTFFEFQVEDPASPVNNVSPAYPADLRAAGVSGQVIAQFVVDTTGRADVSTFKVIEASDQRFAAAVRDALPTMQFTPALVGGRKVKQLVQQAFAFRVAEPLRAAGTAPQSDTVAPRARVMTPLSRGGEPADVSAGGRLPAPPPQAMFEFQVEQPAQAIDPVAPVYPAELREQRLVGQVIAQVVVDSTGAPMMSTFRVIEATHPRFADAVRTALSATRFTPARVRGQPVRQLVQQAYAFALDR